MLTYADEQTREQQKEEQRKEELKTQLRRMPLHLVSICQHPSAYVSRRQKRKEELKTPPPQRIVTQVVRVWVEALLVG